MLTIAVARVFDDESWRAVGSAVPPGLRLPDRGPQPSTACWATISRRSATRRLAWRRRRNVGVSLVVCVLVSVLLMLWQR